MNFVYVGGTDRQKVWVQDALNACSYPLQFVGAKVYVEWVDQLPTSDLNHPYMVTQQNTDGSFTISIPNWADDATNPNLKGLADPATQVQGFYAESVVHELGHVVSYCTFADQANPASLQKMCSLFWTTEFTSGSGVRYGTVGDFGSSTAPWIGLIKEAVAEVFKCAFYRDTLIFFNRTEWNISPESWADFLRLIEPTDLITAVTFDIGGLTDVIANNGPIPLTLPVLLEGKLCKRSAFTTNDGIDSYSSTPSGFFGGEVDGAPDSPGAWQCSCDAMVESAVLAADGTWSVAGVGLDHDSFGESDIISVATVSHENGGGSVAWGVGRATPTMSGSLECQVGLIPGSKLFYRYDLTFLWEVLDDSLVPTGDYVEVAFTISFDHPTAFTQTREIWVKSSSNGQVNTFHYAQFIPNTPASPRSFGDSVSVQASLDTGSIPVDAPYPFVEGHIDLGAGLHGQLVVGG